MDNMGLKLILQLIFSHRTHMQDLKEVTQESHYENFRAAQLSGETELSNGNVEDAPRNGKRCIDMFEM